MNRNVLTCLALTSSLVLAADLKPGQEEAKLKLDKQAAATKTVCASAPYKKAFAAKIKGLACVMGGNKTDPKDFKSRFFVKDGVFTFKMDRDGSGGIEPRRSSRPSSTSKGTGR